MTELLRAKSARPKPRVQARRHGRSWLAVAGYAALAMSCLILGAVTFLIVATPVDLLRDRIVQQLQVRTGRDVTVAGQTSLTLFPRVAVTISELSFAAPAAMRGAPTVAVQMLDAELRIASLLVGRTSIKRVVLTRPSIELRVDARGQRSWELAAGPRKPSRPLDAARLPPETPSAAKARTAAMLEQLSLESVRVIDGALRYVDERGGVRHEVRSLDADLALEGIAGPVQAKGSLTLNGETLAFDGTLTPLRAVVFEDEKARLSGRLAGRPFEATYEGTVSLGSGGLALDGRIGLKAPSAQAVGVWLGQPIAVGRDPGALSLASAVTAADGQVTLSRLEATLGGTSLTGSLALDTRKKPRPYVSGTLRFAELDLGSLLLRPGAAAPQPPVASPPPRASQPRARQPDPIDEILRDDDKSPPRRPQVRGLSKRAGDWSDDVIDLTPLALADADLALSADRVVFKDLATGPGKLTLVLQNKIARVTLEELELYGGRGRGEVTLDGAGDVPAVGVNLSLDAVSALPLLKDALGFDWLDGRSNIKVSLAGQGASERQIVSALKGKVTLAVVNGAVTGIDVGKMLRAVEQARFADLSPSPSDQTQFSEFAGTFVVTNGVAQNQDLRLTSPRVQVSGSGTVNLATRHIDYTARTRLVGGAPGQGNVVSIGNLEIPVRIEGPWQSPSISVPGQEQLLDTAKQIGKNLRSPEVQDAIRGLLGGGDGQQKVKPRDLLDKLLKKP